jgi:periplasmic divalent cation tolerance protein
MPTKSKYALVMVTAPSLKIARRLAQLALNARLAACVNLVRGVESHYWWADKINSSREILMVLKTIRGKVTPLEKLMLAEHPYDTPEFLVLDIPRGNARYLSWISSSTR